MSKITFQSLVEEIALIHESALADGDMNWNQSILASNWKIGQRIIEVEQDSKLRAKYGERLLNTLSQELNRKLGSGFSARNLRYMRQFYLVYKKKNFQPKVSWSHYREIVSLEKKSERDKLEKLVLEQQITVRELIEIKNELLSSHSGEIDNGFYSSEDETIDGLKLLRKPVLQLFTYRVDRKFSMNLAHSVPNLDLGFRIKFELGDILNLEQFKTSDIVSVRKTQTSFQFEKVSSVRELYTYKAYLERVVDGDTLLVHIDLGFGIFIQQRLRLRGIDTSEIESNDGQKAKKLVESELKNTNFLILKTHGSDLYDRYLVDVFYKKDEWKAEGVIEDGNFLNNRLLQERLAVRV